MDNLFSLNGRISRAQYFWYSVVLGLANACLQSGVGSLAHTGQHSESLSPDVAAILWLVECAIFTWSIILPVRRLHDLNRSGWHLWLLCVPLFNIYLACVLVFRKGTEGPNHYGDDPLQIEIEGIPDVVLNS